MKLTIDTIMGFVKAVQTIDQAIMSWREIPDVKCELTKIRAAMLHIQRMANELTKTEVRIKA